MANSSQAESYCVDGDIKFIANDLENAALAYLEGYKQSPSKTKKHFEGLSGDQKNKVVSVLQKWIELDDLTQQGEQTTADEIWAFIFCLEPGSINECFESIDPLLKGKHYGQVIDSCTAMLKQNTGNQTMLLLHRGVARALSSGQEREAVADYLRAFINDKSNSIKIILEKQSDFLPSIQSAMQDCIYSQNPLPSDAKAYKQWLYLTVDCCRFLLEFSSTDSKIQMTLAERLHAMNKYDAAITALTEMHKTLTDNPEKLSEILLRRASCYFAKQHNEQAVDDLKCGLIAVSESEIKSSLVKENTIETEMSFLNADNSKVLEITKSVFVGKPLNFNELLPVLEKAASKLTLEDRFKTVTKVENIRVMLDLFKAMLVLQPAHKGTMFKLGTCFVKMGKPRHALIIFNKLLADDISTQDALLARADCYRELGEKDLAQQDYNALLRQNPRDEVVLCERAMVNLDGDVSSLVTDLLAAYRINSKSVVYHINREPLIQRTKTRQILFEYAKALLQEAPTSPRKLPRPDEPSVSEVINKEGANPLSALSISQLLTRLNPADQNAHILMAHAMYHAGCINDAENKLKKMLADNPQAIDNHVVKLHLGLIKIFTTRIEDGMNTLIDVLKEKGERTISALFRDIPISERARLADDSHKFGIDQLQKKRDVSTVQHSISCFTLAILCCRGTDLVLEGNIPPTWLLLTDSKCLVGISRRDPTKMTHSAWSLASDTNLTFLDKNNCDLTITFPLQTLGRRLDGGTGVYRSYLARAECMAHLGDQRKAILDFSAAIEVNPLCVEGLCGRSFMHLALGDETESINDMTTACDLDPHLAVTHIHALPDEAKKMMLFWLDHRVVALLLNYGYRGTLERINTGGSASTISMIDETALKPGHGGPFHSSASLRLPSLNSLTSAELEPQEKSDDVISDKAPDIEGSLEKKAKNVPSSQDKDDSSEKNAAQTDVSMSRGSTSSTITSYSNYNDVITTMEKVEILHSALLLGKLLINVEPDNISWHGMYADILIVKGEFDEALRHLQIVMDMTPGDVTAVARAGLINVKMNRYISSCRLLSSLVTTDRGGLVYVLKAIDSPRKRKLSEESFKQADSFTHESKYHEARDYYTLSVLSDPFMKVEKLRKRARCLIRIGETSKAILDMNEVIKDTRSGYFNDFCVRGSIYLLEGKELQACRDYMKAIELDRNQTIAGIHVKPGRATMCRVFYREAFDAYSKRNYESCHGICEVALLIDDNDVDMRKLRARAKREITKCAIQ